MPWDFFSYAIIAATAVAGIYIAAELWVHKSIKSPIDGLAVFVAVAAIIISGHLIKVAIDGDLSQLPPDIWRIHLGTAGAFGIVIALQGVVAIFKKLRQPPVRQAGAGNSSSNNGANTEATPDA